MPSHRTVAATVAVALLLTAGGCAAFQGSPDGGEIATETVSTLESVDAYTYDSTVTVRQNGSANTLTASGAVDVADRRLRFRQSVGNESATQYVIGDTVYDNASDAWRSRPLGNGSFWSDQLPLAEQRAILERSNVTLVGDATVDGTDAYELSVNVSDRQLLGYLRQRLGPVIPPGVSLSNVSYTVYVARDDHRLTRMTSDATVSLRSQRVDVNATMDVGNYGENVSIELPPGARNSS